jgi:Uncharacterised nucleotidyltransferase
MEIGLELAEILAGTWRQPSFCRSTLSSENLHRLAPLLIEAGGAALTWFHIRRCKSEFPQSVLNLYREAYIGSVARAAAQEKELERVLSAFQAAGIRSILLKGWSVGRLYPESGLRPSGDIDLWIDPTQQAQANEVLTTVASGRQSVDLDHDQFRRFEARSFREFFGSCETVYLGSTQVKVLRLEDQIRVLCLHFLKHGAWRPIWLCDIAVLLESGNGVFDWKVCLGENPRREQWIASTVALARLLLGAKIPDGAPPLVTPNPPKWLTETVLREWSDPRRPSAAALALVLPSLLHRPWKLTAVMRGRWRNAIQATVDCNGSFKGLPRWPYQVRNAVSRALHFSQQWVRVLWRISKPKPNTRKVSRPSARAASNRKRQADAAESSTSNRDTVLSLSADQNLSWKLLPRF